MCCGNLGKASSALTKGLLNSQVGLLSVGWVVAAKQGAMGTGNNMSRDLGGRQEGGAPAWGPRTEPQHWQSNRCTHPARSLCTPLRQAWPPGWHPKDRTRSGTGRPSQRTRELVCACPGRQACASCEPFPAPSKTSWQSAISSCLSLALCTANSCAPTKEQFQAHRSL